MWLTRNRAAIAAPRRAAALLIGLEVATNWQPLPRWRLSNISSCLRLDMSLGWSPVSLDHGRIFEIGRSFYVKTTWEF